MGAFKETQASAGTNEQHLAINKKTPDCVYKISAELGPCTTLHMYLYTFMHIHTLAVCLCMAVKVTVCAVQNIFVWFMMHFFSWEHFSVSICFRGPTKPIAPLGERNFGVVWILVFCYVDIRCENIFIIMWPLKGQFKQEWQLCHYLLTLMLIQTWRISSSSVELFKDVCNQTVAYSHSHP